MKKYLSLFLIAIVTLFSFNSFAYTAPPPPAHGGYVLDETGKLSKSDIERLNRKIESLKQNTKNEYGIAVIQSTGGDDIADVGQTIFRTWGIGNKQLNNGVLLVIALAERKTRIQTGKGAEGDLPDLKANDILQKTLKPLLKQGKFYEGIDATLDAISSSLDNKTKAVAQLPPPSPPTTNSVDSAFGWIFFAIIIIAGLVMLAIYISTSRAQKQEEKEQEERKKLQSIRENRYSYSSSPPQKLYNEKLYSPQKSTPSIVPAIVAPIAATVIANKAQREEEASRRKRAEASSRRKREEESSRRSTSSYSSSSYGSSSSSSSSSSDSGFGGFGGGDSGGGGSSGDF